MTLEDIDSLLADLDVFDSAIYLDDICDTSDLNEYIDKLDDPTWTVDDLTDLDLEDITDLTAWAELWPESFDTYQEDHVSH